FINKYWDGRIFGNTFLEEDMDKGTIKTGVVQFGLGLSVAPIEIERHTNTNIAGVQEGKKQGMAPMGYRFVPHGVYWMPFFANPSVQNRSASTVEICYYKKVFLPPITPPPRGQPFFLVAPPVRWFAEP